MFITEGGGYSSFAEELRATVAEKISRGEAVELTPQEIMTTVLREEFPGRFGNMTPEQIEEKFDAYDNTGSALRIRARKFLDEGRAFLVPPRNCSYTHRFFARDAADGLHCGIEGFCGDEFVWRIESAEYCYEAFGCAASPLGMRP